MAGGSLPQSVEAPIEHHEYAFQGHRVCRDEAVAPFLRHASAVTGGSCWFLNAGGQQQLDHAGWHCMCGASQPSRAHITWACPHTADLRAGHRLPVNRAEERLFCTHVPSIPPAPHAVDLEGFAESCATAVLDRLQVANSVYISSDRGSKDDVGAFAVVVHCASNAFSAGDGHEDQSAFKQKLNAVHCAAQALVMRYTAQRKDLSLRAAEGLQAMFFSFLIVRRPFLPSLAQAPPYQTSWALGFSVVCEQKSRPLQYLARKPAFVGPVRLNHSAYQIFGGLGGRASRLTVWSVFSSDLGTS